MRYEVRVASRPRGRGATRTSFLVPRTSFTLALSKTRFRTEDRSMRRLVTLFIAFIAFTSSAQTLTVIKAGTLIDGKSSDVRHDQVIVIRGNRIESVGPASAAKIDGAAKVIDLWKMTVRPGLLDCHTHIFLQREDPA